MMPFAYPGRQPICHPLKGSINRLDPLADLEIHHPLSKRTFSDPEVPLLRLPTALRDAVT